jgi:hypothetical protein
MKMSLIIILAGFICAPAAVAQESVVVQSVGIVDYGIYRIELTGERVPVPSAGAGVVRPASRAVLIFQTNQIPATLGTTFGFQFILESKPVGAVAGVDIVVEHPPFKKPNGETTSTLDKVPWRYRIGEKVGYTYTFDHEWEAVPGKWTIEVWQGGRRLVGKDFVVKSERK